ncbi:MAG: MFS transporter, partial [Mycolicibacterium sp.]|nr:MFS transporter [Mycolicibacterium sp.]
AKSATNAFWVFLGFYVVCAFVTWFVFLRMGAARQTAKDDLLPEQAVTA